MATKDRVVQYNYRDAKGEALGSKASDLAVSVDFDFVTATGALNDKGAKVYDVTRTESIVFADYPDNINAAMGAHGWKQKCADLFAGAAGKGEEPAEMLLAGLEHLLAGNWNAATKTGGAGPRISMIKQALENVLVRDYGKEAGEELDAIVAKAVGSEAGLASAKANPAVNAEYEALRLDAMRKRAEAAAAKAVASGEDGEADGFLSGL